METQLNRPTESTNPVPGMPADAVPSRRFYLWLPLLVAGPLILLILNWNPALNQSILHDPLVHVARRAQDGRVFLIGMGFLSAAGIFITHSISTPNVLMSGRGSATGISALLSLVLGSLFFALSGLNLSPQFNRWLMRHARLWLMIFLVSWLTYNWILLVMTVSFGLSRHPP